MEIQVKFASLNTCLSYECIDQVQIGDNVVVLEGVREGLIGNVIAVQRGSYKGELCKCQHTNRKLNNVSPDGQNRIVKERLTRRNDIKWMNETTMRETYDRLHAQHYDLPSDWFVINTGPREFPQDGASALPDDAITFKSQNRVAPAIGILSRKRRKFPRKA